MVRINWDHSSAVFLAESREVPNERDDSFCPVAENVG